MEQNPNHGALWYSGKVKRAVLAVAILLCVYLLIAAVTQIKSWKSIDAMPSNTINVNGHGEVTATPNIATFSFTVEEKAKDVKTAQDAAAQKTNDILAYLKQQGIDDKDVETTYYNITPNYQYSNQVCTMNYPCPPTTSSPTIIGYIVDENVTVKVRDTSKISTVLSGIGGMKVTNLSGLQFTVDNVQDLKKQAQIAAIADARKSANDIAKALGLHVVRVVSYYDNNPYPTDGYGGAEVPQFSAKGASVAPQIATGENKYTADLTVTFEVR